MKTRHTLAVSAAICAVLAGCGQNETQNTGSTAPTTPAVATTSATTPATEEPMTSEAPEQTSKAPATSAAPGGTATRSKDAARGGSDVKVAQTDPGDYGDAAVAAWAKGDKATVAKYVSSSAVADLGSTVPRGELLRTACDGDMCSYTTEAGKRVTLTFDLDKVKAGKGGGITDAKVD